MRFLVAAEQVLDPRASRDQAHALRGRLGRRQREALDQRGMALGELADRRERSRLRQQELDPLLDRGVGWQEAESAAEPPCCAGRCSMRRCLAGGAQRRDGGQIALSCRALDVVRSSRCGCAAVLERASRPLVGAEPPACRASTRRPRGSRAGAGSESGAARRSRGRGRAARSSSRASIARRLGPVELPRPPRAPARTGRPRPPHPPGRIRRIVRQRARAPRSAQRRPQAGTSMSPIQELSTRVPVVGARTDRASCSR